MIRPTKFIDIPALAAIVDEMHERSVYAEMGIRPDIAEFKRLAMQATQRHGFTSNGGMFAMVAEKNDKVEGFLIGALDRIQGFYDHLFATDIIWLCTPRVGAQDPGQLLDAMILWAMSAPKCRQIVLGATSVINDHRRAGKIIQRRGFRQFGAIYERGIRQ